MAEPKPKTLSRYAQLLVFIFLQHYRDGDEVVAFGRDELAGAAAALGIVLPKNLGDVVYSHRYRVDFPDEIASRAPQGKTWTLVTVKRGHYEFRAGVELNLEPRAQQAVIKVPDSTPGIIGKYVLSSEQALLAKVRYNRLIDLFTGIVCYSLQNHVRATIGDGVQIETDEIYLGVDRRGAQYVIPVEAKGGNDRLSVVQMNQDLALAKEKFPGLEVRLVGVQFAQHGDIYMFLFAESSVAGEVELREERRFRLVDPTDISDAELAAYRASLSASP